MPTYEVHFDTTITIEVDAVDELDAEELAQEMFEDNEEEYASDFISNTDITIYERIE